MEKILLEYKEREHFRLMAVTRQALKLVHPFVKQIQEVCDLQIDDRLLHSLLFAGSPDDVVNTIKSKLTGQLKKAGITSPGIRDAAINADLETFYKLFNPFEQERNIQIDRDGLIGLEIHNGEVRIKPDYEAETKEKFCTYVTTPAGKDLYDSYQSTLAAITDFKKKLPDALKNRTLAFFHCDDMGNIGKGQKIDFDFIVQTYTANRDLPVNNSDNTDHEPI